MHHHHHPHHAGPPPYHDDHHAPVLPPGTYVTIDTATGLPLLSTGEPLSRRAFEDWQRQRIADGFGRCVRA